MKRMAIISISEMLSYEDSKFLYGGITPWEAKHLIGNAKERSVKNLIKRRADTIGLSIDYISLTSTKN